MNRNEQGFLDSVRKRLDNELDQLEPSVVRRLRESRMRALTTEEKSIRLLYPRLIPVGGCTVLTVVAIAASLWFSLRPAPFSGVTGEEIEVMGTQGNLEMFRELEFYQWLAQTDETR